MGGSQGIGGPGRTMKECEDQLGALKKENFNLKLRIYFLEERMGITSADEDAIRKNIELKVSILPIINGWFPSKENLGNEIFLFAVVSWNLITFKVIHYWIKKV